MTSFILSPQLTADKVQSLDKSLSTLPYIIGQCREHLLRMNKGINMKKQLIRVFGLFALLLSGVSFSDGEHQIFELGDFQLENGEILPSAFLS